MYSPEDDDIKSETWLAQNCMYISVMQARHTASEPTKKHFMLHTKRSFLQLQFYVDVI